MKRKSFNHDPLEGLPLTLLVSGAIGVALCVIVIPLAWPGVCFLWAEMADVLAALGLHVHLVRPPETEGMDPLTSAHVLLSEAQTPYLLACSLVMALSLGLPVAIALRSWLEFHDGTWIGGKRSATTAHGDARLVTRRRELLRHSHPWHEGETPEGGDVVVGSVPGALAAIDVAGGMAVLGQSGDGKSRRLAVLTIVLNVLLGRSIVINDISGELETWTRDWVESLGTHEVHAVRFGVPQASEAYDPLGRARSAVASGDVGVATSELRELARQVVPKNGRENPVFPDGARDLFVGLGLYVLASDEVPDTARNLSTMLALITPRGGRDSVGRLEELQERLAPTDPAAPFLAGVSGESGGGPGMALTLKTYLTQFVDREVAPMLVPGGVNLVRVGEVPTVLYVSSSSAAGNRSSLVGVFFSQTLASLRSCAAENGGSCPVRTLLLEDEFASMGRCDRLLQDMGEIRKENISVALFWQGFRQMEAVAGYDRAQSALFLDLCKSKAILSCGDNDVAKSISDQMGTYTALVTNSNRSRGQRGGSTGSSDSSVRRPLIDSSELMSWTAKEVGMLVLHDGLPLVFQSHDVSETFVHGMLGMDDMDGLRAEQEERLRSRGLPQPEVWEGPALDAGDGEGNAATTAALTYTPEGF